MRRTSSRSRGPAWPRTARSVHLGARSARVPRGARRSRRGRGRVRDRRPADHRFRRAIPTPIADAGRPPADPGRHRPDPRAGRGADPGARGRRRPTRSRARCWSAPGTKRFVPFDEAVLGNGAEVDARKGPVELTDSDGGKALFYSGHLQGQHERHRDGADPERAARLQGGKARLAAAKKPRPASCGARARGVQDRATTARRPSAAPPGSSRTRARPRRRGHDRDGGGPGHRGRKTVVLRKGKTYVARARK